jgi:modulator of drug activity B
LLIWQKSLHILAIFPVTSITLKFVPNAMIRGLTMSNILIINGAKKFAHSNGQLNDTLTESRKVSCATSDMMFRLPVPTASTTQKKNVQKYLWADTVIYQMPGWWMGAPWTMKKYIDDVFTEGHGSLYASDGRTRSDAEKKYGSGGLIQGKTYMLSLTWNAPLQAFEDKEQFFHGVGVDGVYLPFHKANEFLGMEALPTFIANDVMKVPDVPRFVAGISQASRRDFCLTVGLLKKRS